jgi:hypothetical protein
MPSADPGQTSYVASSAGERPEQRARAWLLARARLVPNALAQSPPWVRSVFEHAWAPMEALRGQVRCLPSALWDYLLDCEGGFVAIGAGNSRYVVGPTLIRNRTVHNVAFVSVADLAEDNERPLHVIGHLIDHYLGCGGTVDGLWLSAGGGMRSHWQQAAQRLPGLFALGYAVDEIAGCSIEDYFAQSLALNCRDRQRLNVADPQIYKWFRTTLWDDAFWQGVGGANAKGV